MIFMTIPKTSMLGILLLHLLFKKITKNVQLTQSRLTFWVVTFENYRELKSPTWKSCIIRKMLKWSRKHSRSGPMSVPPDHFSMDMSTKPWEAIFHMTWVWPGCDVIDKAWDLSGKSFPYTYMIPFSLFIVNSRCTDKQTWSLFDCCHLKQSCLSQRKSVLFSTVAFAALLCTKPIWRAGKIVNLQIWERRQIPRDRRRMPPRMPHRKRRIKQVHQVISLPGQRVSVTSSNSDSKALDFFWEKIISIRAKCGFPSLNVMWECFWSRGPKNLFLELIIPCVLSTWPLFPPKIGISYQ